MLKLLQKRFGAIAAFHPPAGRRQPARGLEPLENRTLLSGSPVAVLPSPAGAHTPALLAAALPADTDTDTVLLPGVKFTYIDANNATVTITYSGNAGAATVARADDGNVDSIAIAGSNSTSGLTISVSGGIDMGIASIGAITDDSPINHITAPGVDMTGAGVTFADGGFANALALRDVAAGASIVEPGANAGGVTVSLASVGAGATISLASQAAFTASDWSGGGSITAPWLTSLTITGDRSRSLQGNFGADLNLSGVNAPHGLALGSATITGTITGGTWTIHGAAGAIKTTGSIAPWSAVIDGKVASFIVSDSAGGSLAAASLPTLTVDGNSTLSLNLSGAGVPDNANTLVTATIGDEITGGTWTIEGNVGKIVALGATNAWSTAIDGNLVNVTFKSDAGGTLGADSIGRLTVKGYSSMSLNLSGDGLPKGKNTLGPVSITRGITGGTWDVTGNTSTITTPDTGPAWSTDITGTVTILTISGDASGNIQAGVINSFKVTGNLVDATVTLTQANDPAHPHALDLGTLYVNGSVNDSQISSASNVGSLSVLAMNDSQVLVGVAAGVTGLATAGSDFAFQPTNFNSLGGFTVRGLPSNEPSFTGSDIDAWRIGSVILRAVDSTLEDLFFGVAADHIGLLGFYAKGINTDTNNSLTNLSSPADLTKPANNPTGVTFPVGSFMVNMV